MSITEFLLARIAEDEDYLGALAHCAAQRRIVERHSHFHNGWHDDAGEPMLSCIHDMKAWPCPDLLDLASAYADHPDYREEWAIIAAS